MTTLTPNRRHPQHCMRIIIVSNRTNEFMLGTLDILPLNAWLQRLWQEYL